VEALAAEEIELKAMRQELKNKLSRVENRLDTIESDKGALTYVCQRNGLALAKDK